MAADLNLHTNTHALYPHHAIDRAPWPPHVLLIESDTDYREIDQATLRLGGWQVTTPPNEQHARHLLRREEFDLCVVECRLAARGDLSLCNHIRESSMLPIIVLALRAEESLALDCLDRGADSYLLRPFDPKSLRALAGALARRYHRRFPDLLLVPGRGEAWTPWRRLLLPRRVFALLHLLAARAGQPLSRSQLALLAWGESEPRSARQVEVAIRRLRGALEPAPIAPRLIVQKGRFRYHLAGLARIVTAPS